MAVSRFASSTALPVPSRHALSPLDWTTPLRAEPAVRPWASNRGSNRNRLALPLGRARGLGALVSLDRDRTRSRILGLSTEDLIYVRLC
mgnify:CR=1 FL=1